jgi:hypothetical protein
MLSMNKILNLSFALLMLAATFTSCERKNQGDINCGTPTVNFLAKDRQRVYKYIVGALPADSSFTSKSIQATQFIFKNEEIIKPSNALNINGYWKACGGELYRSLDAFDMDEQITSGNKYIPATYNPGNTWNNKFNGVTYYMGCAAKGIPTSCLKGIYDTDKLWIKTSPANIKADTFYWNKEIGVARMFLSNGRVYDLASTNY